MNIPLMVEVPDIALRAANVNLGSIKHKELERANRLALAYERLRDDIAEYVRRKMQTGPGYTLADLEERLAKCLADIDRIEKEN